MTWLRIDDGFTSNAKIAQLNDHQFRVWIRLLCHCGKSNDPSVDGATIQEVSGLTRAIVKRYASLALVDQIGDAYEVHNWAEYQPKDSPTERQARWRARTAASTAASTPASTSASTNGVTNASTKKSTRARARADSRPVQSLRPSTNNGSLDADADEHKQLAGLNDPLAQAALEEIDREMAKLNTLLAQAAIEDMGP